MNTQEESFVAAIEIGSSKITGMIGKRLIDGSIQVRAMVQENSSSFIRKGGIYNMDKTVTCLKGIKTRLQNETKREIKYIYACFSGQGLHSVRNTIKRNFETETKISQEIVDSINEENREQNIPDYYLVDVVTQEYKLGSQFSMSPVGVLTNEIEGYFLNVVIRESFYNKITSCFKQAGIDVKQFYITPIALAEAILDVDAYKRPGCALVDFGRSTTTVSVYQKNLLRHISVIPLGSDNITKDLATSLSIEESEAEELKIKYGSAYTEIPDEDESSEDECYTLKDGRTVQRKLFDDIVEARMEEILVNVSDQITASGIKDTLIAGVVLTGGGSNIKNIEKAFSTYVNIFKLKVAKYANFAVNSKLQEAKAQDGTLNAILGMFTLANGNCAGKLLDDNDSLFKEGGDDGADGENTGEIVSHDDDRDKGEEKSDNGKKTDDKEKPKSKKSNWFKVIWEKTKKLATNFVSPDDSSMQL